MQRDPVDETEYVNAAARLPQQRTGTEDTSTLEQGSLEVQWREDDRFDFLKQRLIQREEKEGERDCMVRRDLL